MNKSVPEAVRREPQLEAMAESAAGSEISPATAAGSSFWTGEDEALTAWFGTPANVVVSIGGFWSILCLSVGLLFGGSVVG